MTYWQCDRSIQNEYCDVSMSRTALISKSGSTYLSKVTLAQDSQKVKVIQSHLARLKTNLLLGLLLENIEYKSD
jgi:hypothetical protein